MNATPTKGIWEEPISPNIMVLFDTTRNPERITIQHKGKNPVHFDFEDGIFPSDITRAMKTARESIV